MKVILIGGNGFVGNSLTKQLLKNDCEVVVTTRLGSSVKNAIPEVSYIGVNYNEGEELCCIFEKEQPDYIVHLASGKDRRSLKEVPTHELVSDFQVNLNIVQAATRLNGLKRFIFIGSSDQYDMSAFTRNFPNIYSPSNSYGFLKSTTSLLLDTLFRESNFPIVQLIPTIIYGQGQGEEMFLPALINTLSEGETIEMTKGEQFRDFVYIDDLVNAILISLFDLDNQFLGKTYSICSGEPVKLVDLVKLVVNLTKADIKQVQIGKKEYRLGESMEFECSYLSFNNDASWQPETTLERGILNMIQSQ